MTFREDLLEVFGKPDKMAAMIPRWICLLAVSILTVSCQSPAPKVTVASGASIAGRELVLFEFGNAWLANHSMVQVLYQELARRGMAVKLALEPGETLRPDAMILYLEHVGDTKEQGKGRIDYLTFLKFSLRDTSGKQLAEVSYSGNELDKLEQKTLAKEILDRLLAASGA